MRYHEIVAESAQTNPQWPATLADAEAIADFIESIAGSDVDHDMMVEYFRGGSATLKLVPIESIQQGAAAANVKVRGREAKYAKMPPETMPPLVVEGGKIMDGNHRYRVALKRGTTHLWVYEVE